MKINLALERESDKVDMDLIDKIIAESKIDSDKIFQEYKNDNKFEEDSMVLRGIEAIRRGNEIVRLSKEKKRKAIFLTTNQMSGINRVVYRTPLVKTIHKIAKQKENVIRSGKFKTAPRGNTIIRPVCPPGKIINPKTNRCVKDKNYKKPKQERDVNLDNLVDLLKKIKK
jgi:hypothetical protein